VTHAPAVLRPATADDLQAIQALMVQTWHHLYERLARESRLSTRYHTPPTLREELEDPDQELIVAEIDGELVATATGRNTADGAYEIERVYVRPDMQGRGLGVQLFERLVRDAGDRPVRVEIDARNRRGIEFYVERGFVEVGERERGQLPPKLTYVVMQRPPPRG
jgi:GNAT superfamily N-acetyltransferase